MTRRKYGGKVLERLYIDKVVFSNDLQFVIVNGDETIVEECRKLTGHEIKGYCMGFIDYLQANNISELRDSEDKILYKFTKSDLGKKAATILEEIEDERNWEG